MFQKTRKTTAKLGGLCEERSEKGRGGRKVERKGKANNRDRGGRKVERKGKANNRDQWKQITKVAVLRSDQ